MKKALTILFLLISLTNIYSQDNSHKISLLVSSRVDTSQQDVNSVLKLYDNYLNSRPDSIYDNPYWNKAEKKQYVDFDFSRSSIFQGGMSPSQLAQYFSPFVMSIEPNNDKYQIRVMFSSSTVDPQYAGSKVWCIQKLNAIKENEKWVLENLIVDLTQNWETIPVGFINYVYPPSFNFNIERAKQSEQFCNDIIKRFNPDYKKPFKFYITNSIDDMGLLENFDYYFVGITTGKAGKDRILSAKGNEFYPHEFVHKLIPKNLNRSYLIEEGLAVFLGTKMNTDEYKAQMSKLGKDISDQKLNFEKVVSQKVKFNGYQTAYPAGAAICELVYNSKGDKGLKQLMLSDTSDYEKIVLSTLKITNLSKSEMLKEWTNILIKYSN